jgi:hypothetical protein
MASDPVSQLRNMREEDLFLALGQQIAEGEEHMRPPSPAELVVKGKVWFQSHLASLQGAVCQVKVRSLIDGDDAVLLAAVADLIAGLCLGVSPVTVSYLICKRGMKSFCGW